MQQVISDLERLGRKTKTLLLVQRVSVVLACILAAMIGLILFDFALRLPSAFRLVLLLGGLIALGYAQWRYVRPALMFRPGLTELALRVERVLPGVAGRLASSVEFVAAGVDQSNQLAARAVRETQTRFSGESVNTIIDAKRTWRDLGLLALALAAATALTIASPAGAMTGVKRILLPYSDAKWPARTGVASLMDMQVHPRGQALPLRAEVTRGSPTQNISAHYRLRINGIFQDWQRIVLTPQMTGGASGTIHERLIDSNAEQIELYFSSDDDRTPLQQIEFVPPPAVRRASLTITPPAYAAAHLPVMHVELGQGLDARAITETPSLINSNVELQLELNKPLPEPDDLYATLGWPSETSLPQFGIDADDQSVWRLQWTLTQTLALSLNLVDEHGLSNADPISYRIEAVEDYVPAVTITEPEVDETVLPTAVIGLRAEARDDVALADIGLQAHVQSGGRTPDESLASTPAWQHDEDVSEASAFTQAELELQSLHVSEGDVVLVSGVARDVYETAEDRQVRSLVRRLRVIGETDFATQLRRQLGAVRQNAIRIEAQQAELQDDVIESGVPQGSGMDRAQAQIAERIATQRASVEDIERLLRQNRLDDPQLSQILQQSNDLLDAAGRAANRAVEKMEQQRGQKSETTAQNSDSAGKRSEQQDQKSAGNQKSEAGDQKSEPGAQTPRTGAQSPQTGAQSPQTQGQQGETGAQSPQSGAQSPQSPENQEQQPQADEQRPQPQDPATRDVTDAQQEVRDELSDLIKLLDRDEDTWVIKRQLENLLKEQSSLEQATGQLGNQTMGRRPEDLTEQQRTDLDKIAQRQRDLRDEARKMIENMRNRAKAMEQVDSQAAESMRSAADTAEQRQLDSDMENAAQKAQQNQMTSAQASQQSAQSTMQRMLNDMENTRRAQAQQLIRQLASLVESIQRLITVQENELTALGLAKDANNFSGLDRSMIRLNQNTQAVAGEARSAGQETRRIARSLDRAADTQGAAVMALRAQPVQIDEAEAAENRSLELLKEAKQLAEELQKQTQEQEVRRRREELMNAYSQFAERQIALREETLPLSQVQQLDRRQLIEARRLGTSQDEIRTGLNQLRDTTSEVLDSPIFVHVHRAIDSWSSQISDSLAGGKVNIDVTDRQQQIADSIGRLIKALEESLVPPDEFADRQNQNGGEGQQQGDQPLIPPVAQLKLLQGLQEQVYDLTKSLDSRQDLDQAQRRERLRDIGQQQRELMDLGRQMLEQLQQQQKGPQTPEELVPPPEQTPDEEPLPQ